MANNGSQSAIRFMACAVGLLVSVGFGWAQPFPGGMPKCQADLSGCTEELANCDSEFGTCNANLGTCQEALIQCQAQAPAPIAQTGQENCFNALGNPVICAGTGQDGDLRPGVAWPNPRFADMGNGTILDHLTGLIWLKDWDCLGSQVGDQRTWEQALTASNTLSQANPQGCDLTDGSTAGDWRLPSVRELFSLGIFRFDFKPGIPDTIGTGQWSANDPFVDVPSVGPSGLLHFWSSTTKIGEWEKAYYVDFQSGRVADLEKTEQRSVVAVRDLS